MFLFICEKNHCICTIYYKYRTIALYCIVLYCIVLYCIVLYCIVLYCIVNCIVLWATVLYCNVNCIVLYYEVLYYKLYCIVLWGIVLYCNVNCIVLYYEVLYCIINCIVLYCVVRLAINVHVDEDGHECEGDGQLDHQNTVHLLDEPCNIQHSHSQLCSRPICLQCSGPQKISTSCCCFFVVGIS